MSSSTASPSEDGTTASGCLGPKRRSWSELVARKSRTVSWASNVATVVNASVEKPLFQGLLWKESLHLKRWSLRWCVIPADRAEIHCYVKRGDKTPSEVISLASGVKLAAYYDPQSWAVELGPRALCYDWQCASPGGSHCVSKFMRAIAIAIGDQKMAMDYHWGTASSIGSSGPIEEDPQ